MSKIVRPIKVYIMHGRTSGKVLQYDEFFNWVGALPRNQTQVQINPELAIALDGATKQAERWEFRFVSGNPAEVPLFYDETAGRTFEEEPEEGRWRAIRTRVAIDPGQRLLAIEMRRAGVGSINLERYFTTLSKREGYHPKVTLDFNPLPSPSFLEEIDSLQRIREAEIVVRRPNTDWDDADDVLSGLADDSGGHRATVNVGAARGESLNRSRGIMGLIKKHVRRPLTNVNDVRVKGMDAGTGRLRTVSLGRNQFQGSALFASRVPIGEEDRSVLDFAGGLLDRGAELAAELSDLRSEEELG